MFLFARRIIGMSNHYTNFILKEIRRTVTFLGGHPEAVDDPSSAYRELERLTKDTWLLATVGTWKDGMNELEVLNFLRDWNVQIPSR